MRTINIHAAKANLFRLVARAAKGEPFVIAKAGKPLVKVVALDAASPTEIRRPGFLSRQIAAPDDFNRMVEAEIARAFETGN